jgi:probable F420-dependent oxidoreductase
MEIGRVGIWTFALDLQPAAKAQAAAAEIEALGYGAIWIPEALGREAFTNSALLLAGTRRIAVATGIANIWARDAMAMAAAQKTLAEAYADRFLLGIGVSHAPLVGMRGHEYGKPLSAMRSYLDAMDSAPFMAAAPATPPQRVIAALAPKMLQLAAERAWGSHPLLRATRAHGIRPQDPRQGPTPGARASGRVGDRCDEGTRGGADTHEHLPRAAELREQPQAARLHRR